MRGLYQTPLLLTELSTQEKLSHPQNCIHGGTNFMADVGQKFTFGATGLLCRLFRRLERPFSLTHLLNDLTQKGVIALFMIFQAKTVLQRSFKLTHQPSVMAF